MESGIASDERELDATGVDADASVGLEGGESVDEGRVAEATGVAQLAAGQRLRRAAERLEDPVGG